jgi:hypothetical protein
MIAAAKGHLAAVDRLVDLGCSIHDTDNVSAHLLQVSQVLL